MVRRTRWATIAMSSAILLTACYDLRSPLAPGGDGGSGEPEPALVETLDRERARIAAEAARSRSDDALRLAWERYRAAYVANSPLLVCYPHSYAGEAQIIGPEGGVVRAGPHQLTIPAGALSEPVVVSMEAPLSFNVEVRLSPHGLNFAVQPRLTLSYRHCWTPHRLPYRMAYVDDLGRITEWPMSQDDELAGVLHGWIWHFSRYAVVAD